MNKILLLLVLGIIPALVGTAYAQSAGIDVPIEFTGAEITVLFIGGLAGLTTAYLGYRKAKAKDNSLKFNITRFMDRVIIAVLTSVGLAIGVASDLLILNLFTMYLIFVSALGTAELVMELRTKNAS